MNQINKKHLWIFNHYAVAPDLPGGTRHFDFGKELVKRGYQVTIFAAGFNYLLRQELKLASHENWKLENVVGVNFVWLKTFPYQTNNWRRIINIVSYMIRAYRIGSRLSRLQPEIKPPVIIGSTVHPLAALAAWLLAKKFRAKFILELRDLWPQSLIDMKQLRADSVMAKILRHLENFLCKHATRIIVLSSATTSFLLDRGYPSAKISVISNGVDLDQYPRTRQPENQIFTILYTGALSFDKALLPALEAAKILEQSADIKFKLIFFGSGVDQPRLEQETRNRQLTNVEFRPPVSKKEIPRELQSADALLLMQDKILHDGSSNKFMDYLAASRPIIFVTHAETNIKIIQQTNCGLAIPPRDAPALAKAILKIYNSSIAEREQMGARGRAYAEAHHAIPVLVDQLEPLLTD